MIGKGGAVIRALTEETGTTIDITDDGVVMIACISAEGGELARKRIEDITAEVEVGRIYDGTVLKLLDFGAIVSVLPGKDGLLHISQIANERVNNVSDHLKEGQAVRVKVLEADEKGRLRLSMKAVNNDAKIPRNAPMKFGFPKVPKILLYSLFHPTKSPKRMVQPPYRMLMRPAVKRPYKRFLNELELRRTKVDKKTKDRQR